MTRHTGFHVILAGALLLTACGGGDRVNNSSTEAVAPAETAGQTATAANGGAAAASPQAPAAGGTAASVPGATGAPSGTSGSPASGAVAQSAQPGAAAPAPAAPEFREVIIPEGTRLPLELLTSLSSETTAVEAPVRARLTNPVEIGGVVAMPAGTELTGVVTESERAGRVKGRSRLAFRFTSADVRGTPERIRTNAVVFVGEESTKSDAAKIGGGAVAGAVIGGILGGGKGAAEGAAIGGGAGTGVVLSTRGKEVSIARGATVTATLADAVTLQVPR